MKFFVRDELTSQDKIRLCFSKYDAETTEYDIVEIKIWQILYILSDFYAKFRFNIPTTL